MSDLFKRQNATAATDQSCPLVSPLQDMSRVPSFTDGAEICSRIASGELTSDCLPTLLGLPNCLQRAAPVEVQCRPVLKNHSHEDTAAIALMTTGKAAVVVLGAAAL